MGDRSPHRGLLGREESAKEELTYSSGGAGPLLPAMAGADLPKFFGPRRCPRGWFLSHLSVILERMFDSVGVLPKDFEGLGPLPALAAFLSTLSDVSLSGHDRIRVLKTHQRLASFFQAQVFEDMAAISELMTELEADPEIAADAAAAEIGAALHLTRRAADFDLALAVDLKERLPQVWEALAAGKIDLRRVRVIVSAVPPTSPKELPGRWSVGSSKLLPVSLPASWGL